MVQEFIERAEGEGHVVHSGSLRILRFHSVGQRSDGSEMMLLVQVRNIRPTPASTTCALRISA
ncbi:hypothetical protein MMAG44476_34334 [Mycolicibacterium mageritense DSM 44476 = CIP 104973]